MKINVFKRYPYWKNSGEKWLEFHTDKCFCEWRGCRQASKGKNHIIGWTIRIGNIVVAIYRGDPKGCNAPF